MSQTTSEQQRQVQLPAGTTNKGSHFRCNETPTLDRIFKNASSITGARQGSHYPQWKLAEEYPWTAEPTQQTSSAIANSLQYTPVRLRLGAPVLNPVLNLGERYQPLSVASSARVGSSTSTGRASRLTS